MPLQQTIAPTVEPVSVLEAKNWVRADSDLTNDDALLALVIAAARRFAESYTRTSFISQGWRLVADAFPQPYLWGVPFGQVYSLPPNAFQLERGPVLSVTGITYLDMNGTLQTAPTATYVVDASGDPCRVAPAFGQIWQPTLPQIGSVKVDYLAGMAAGVKFDSTADTFTPSLWPTLAIGDQVVFTLSGDAASSLPAPLATGTSYFVQSIPQAGSYKLAATSGGAAIDITGNLSAGALAFMGTPARPGVLEGLRHWMQVRLGTLYTNREEVALLLRGKIELLPYVDMLLDPYRVEVA